MKLKTLSCLIVALIIVTCHASPLPRTLILCWNPYSYDRLKERVPGTRTHTLSRHNHIIGKYFIYKNNYIVVHQAMRCPPTNINNVPVACTNFFLKIIHTFKPKKIIALQTAGIINASAQHKLQLYKADAIYFSHKCLNIPNPLPSELPSSTVIYTRSYVNRFGTKHYCGQSTVLLDSNSAAIPLAYTIYTRKNSPGTFPKILVIVAVTDIDLKTGGKKAKREYENDKYRAADKMVSYVLKNYS